MRDLLLVAFLFIAIYFTFKRPYIGVAAWIWIALMAPSQWAYGFSSSFRLNFTIVIVTAMALMFSKFRNKFTFSPLSSCVLLFGLWACFSTAATLSYDQGEVFSYLIQFIKTIMLFIFIVITVQNKIHINTIIWTIVLSISAYAGMEALKYLMSGGGHKIVGRAGIIADRNDLAVAINMCIPLVLYLINETKNKWVKRFLIVLVFLNILSIIGTYSRAGFIGLSIFGIAYYLKSNRKILLTIMAVILIPVAIVNAPQDWKERQSTVKTAAQDDMSFTGRLWAWKISVLVAMDHPLTGAGFGSTQMAHVWWEYAPMTDDFVYSTRPIHEDVIPKAAHSIYFQVIGDHGFGGFIVFGSMLMFALLTNIRNRKMAQKTGEKSLEYLSKCISLCLIGYFVTGASVSLAYFDLIYAVLGIIAVSNVVLRKRLENEKQLHATANPAT